tara:strand:+ start:88 stop:321 length:234 start_codon:yes stop_codon:yes gene_type:complete
VDVLTHTLLATACMAGSFYLGRFLAGRTLAEPIIEHVLDKLERDGFIITETDKDGDKEIVPISELIAKALRDASKTT